MTRASIILMAVACCGAFLLAAPLLTNAQFSLPVPGLELPGKKSSPASPAAPGGQGSPQVSSQAPGAKASTSPVTHRNPGRRFEFTLPAGWAQISGNVADESGALFNKAGTDWHFQYHMTQMTPSFPAEAGVSASLRQSKEEIAIKKLLAAKRRDGGVKKPGTPRVIGWEIVESEKGAGGFQRIIWQCYDQDNYYFNFMASTTPANFPQARSELQQIIDSIVFK